MFCNKCGNEVSSNHQFCNKCGNALFFNVQNKNAFSPNKRIKKNWIIIPIGIIVFWLIIFKILNNDNYFFNNDNTVAETTSTTNNSKNTKKSYKTSIIVDNTYSGVTINNEQDAIKLISEDSTKQKQSDYPKEIIEVENSIIEKYSITAVNLKEMDVDFAKELEKVIENIYSNYPSARGHLTNLTLVNYNISLADAIAAFEPTFLFATSNTSTTKPWVIKTQIKLNSKYFLNPERIEKATENSSKVGHFPPNANKYSSVAHEFGHYLSFIALLNHYSTDSITLIENSETTNYYNIIKDFCSGEFSKQMLEEAYQNYIRNNRNISFDEWRGQISDYALAKDNEGEYIYDETIAEAFHDVYLNNENANIASKYIVQVLKKYIER